MDRFPAERPIPNPDRRTPKPGAFPRAPKQKPNSYCLERPYTGHHSQ